METVYSNHTDISDCEGEMSYQDHFMVQAVLSLMYSVVFIVAVTGNILVIYVVATNKEMQTVTNIFITNLAIADLLVNFTSLWLTPCYIFLGHWIWGSVMCHLVPLFQGMSTFISSLTLTAIAVDRYIVILYPFRQRMSLRVCLVTVIGIWFVGSVSVAPLAAHMELVQFNDSCGVYICREAWEAYPEMRVVYGFVVLSLQFVLPFAVIAFCYIRIWHSISSRKSMLNEFRSSISSLSDDQRRRHLLKMMSCMVIIFGLCWLPVNTLNVLRDATPIDKEEYFVLIFLFAHLCSMSATCWNPILYAWMNENFRREFKAVLPCFDDISRLTQSGSVSKVIRRAPPASMYDDQQTRKYSTSPFPNQRNRSGKKYPISVSKMDDTGSLLEKPRAYNGKFASDHDSVRLALLCPVNGQHTAKHNDLNETHLNGDVNTMQGILL